MKNIQHRLVLFCLAFHFGLACAKIQHLSLVSITLTADQFYRGLLLDSYIQRPAVSTSPF
jgi:hypothetical protein